ncbi:MAG: hypothetical protein KBD06_02455 [Candidatus Pacebacteria bacterium]|nr:hypothetical protein [Candidatus Paceibacterota bacterium]
MTRSYTILPFVLLCLISFLSPQLSHADSTADLTVVPVVVDEKAKARDILKETITITNTTQRKLTLFPTVNDVKSDAGQEEFVSAQGADDKKDSLANWIELSRGVVELTPGETREIPFVIRVSLNALPGTYHADVSFFEGSARAEAEARNPLAVVTVNTEVQADIKESMQLNKFMTDGFFFSGDDVLFNYQVENIGNQELKPKGEIRIYDRKGREVASIPVNAEGKSLTPDQQAQLASAWSSAQGFGKFKAFLNIDYGNNQSGKLQDTVFFWIIPWQQLLAILVISIIAIIASALYFHRWLEHRHMQRFAIASGVAGANTAAMQAPPGMVAPPAKPAQITAVMPPAPSKPEKKGFFARFRRTKKTEGPIARATQDAVTTETPAPVAHVAPQTVSEAPRVIPQDVPREIPSAAAPRSSGTIDLTSAQVSAPSVRHAGHVINLKDGA